MDSASCEAGIKSTMTSHPVDVSSSKLLEFDYYLNLTATDNMGDLSVYAFFTSNWINQKENLNNFEEWHHIKRSRNENDK